MKNNYLLALSSAFLLWLAWPPTPFTSFLLLIALVPLLIAVENIIYSNAFKKKSLKVFKIAFLCFFIWNTACIYWIFNSLNAVMPVWTAAIISIIPFGLGSLLMTISFWLYYQMRKVSRRWWSYAALVCFWIGYEYLHQSWDLAFPWMNLGNGFARDHYLVQWYEYTGVYGGTYWVLMSNILLFETYLAYKSAKAKKDLEIKNYKLVQLLARFALHIAVPVLLSFYMYYSNSEKINPSNVVVVQPNIDPYAKFGTMPVFKQIEVLIRLSDSLGKANTEYFIWPETAISKDTDEESIRQESNYLDVKRFLNKYKNGNVITGIESYAIYKSAKTSTARLDERSGNYFDVFNAAIQIENSPKIQFYHKSKLVPGVEQIPFSGSLSFIKPFFQDFGGSAGSYGKQAHPSVFYSQNGIGAAPVICYESIWGEYVSDYVQQGAQFITIITNDAWWGNTSGKDQHLQYAKLRAIETRRWVARSANTGISAFINQRGDIVQQSGWWQTTALSADINLNDDQTFYVKHKDYIAFVGCLGSFGFGLFLLYVLFVDKKQNGLKHQDSKIPVV
ncbi:MAG: apolipoprotein N-acyltransferase [Flavobacterium sp.]|nr:apolipoprotein N-acyltransferase [Pedobacter sp.]